MGICVYAYVHVTTKLRERMIVCYFIVIITFNRCLLYLYLYNQ